MFFMQIPILDFTLDNSLRYTHYQHTNSHFDFHLHDGYEIYYLIQGDVQYFVERTNYPLISGDIVITNSEEIHKPSFLTTHLYERICIEFDPKYFEHFNTSSFNLFSCFIHRENGKKNKLPRDASLSKNIYRQLKIIEELYTQRSDGYEILIKNCVIDILVKINRSFQKTDTICDSFDAPINLQQVLDYIHHHLEHDLSLEFLEKKYFINRFYLCKLFKKHTGNSLHHYIIYKRMSLAKKLILENKSFNEVSELCGYQNYSNFVRIFKQTVGSTPSNYKKSHTSI